MKPKYFKKGAMIWKFTPETEAPNAFVRIVGSIEGWTESVMVQEDMAESRAIEITEEEGEAI